MPASRVLPLLSQAASVSAAVERSKIEESVFARCLSIATSTTLMMAVITLEKGRSFQSGFGSNGFIGNFA
jgi:hypothetical protein